MTNTVLEALKTRRSIRAYKPEQITDEQLQAVLEAGTWAPTGMGYQDPWIVAVQNPSLRKRISEMNRKVWGKDTDPFYGAPTYVLVFASRPEKWANGFADGSLVLAITNVSLDKAQTIDFAIDGYNAKSVSGRILTSKNVADYNDFKNPNVVAPKEFKEAKLNKNKLTLTIPAKSIIVLNIK